MPSTHEGLIAREAGPTGEIAVELLLEAGAVLATSLDLKTTIAQVARLTVPRAADLCVIDLSDEDGAIKDVAVAASDERVARGLEELRRRHPLDREGDHPVARVIRSGEPELLPEMSAKLLRSFAQGAEHARFMLEHGYRSALVTPLLARGRTLGALSLLRLGPCEPYAPQDVALGEELARRAALAIDNARLYSEVRRVEQRLEAILSNLAEAVTVEDAEGQTVFANRAAAALLGVETGAELTRSQPGAILERLLVHDEQGRQLALEDMPGRRLFAGELPGPLLVRGLVRATGEERWLIIRSSPIIEAGTGGVLYAANVFENITGVKRAQLAESFMAEASRTLASSLDHAETLRRVARLAVPEIADWCAVDVLDEHGELERAAAHHSDPAKLALLEQLHGKYGPALDADGRLPEVIRTGRPRILTDIAHETLAEHARDAEHLRMLKALGPRSIITVPLAAPARTFGALTLGASTSSRQLTHDDLGLAVRLGRRCGTAVESARLYTERTRIAKILESALLPESLPEIPGFDLQARYRAAGELNDVGGDFYDVFSYGKDRWMLVIGDVCGKGPRAAGVTALARHTLRAAALLGQTPAVMLATLHAALRRQPLGADLCTVCLVTVKPLGARAELGVALAGHPPPMIIDAAAGAVQIGRPGTLLGVIDPIEVNEVRAELRTGQTLLLYTDGVLEADRSQAQHAERTLLETCRGAHTMRIGELLDLIEQTASASAAERLRDDIALLCIRPRRE